MAVPRQMVHVEWIAPDLRYALLLILALMLLVRWLWRRMRKAGGTEPVPAPKSGATHRVLIALGCGFVVDWTLWLAASGNGRYLIPMACVVAVLDVALIFRLFAGRPAARNCFLATVMGAQIFQLCIGTEYRPALSWHDGPWVNLSLPASLPARANLYFLMGEQTHSFIIPYLPRGSGFINLDGEYTLGPDGTNGMRIQRLIERFNPYLRIIVSDPRGDTGADITLPDPSSIGDALRPFGLQVEGRRCARIVAHGVTALVFNRAGAGRAPRQGIPVAPNTEYLLTCRLVWNGPRSEPPIPGQRAADLAFDHLEDSCPALFQPRRPADIFTGDPAHGYVFSRRYANTEILAWIARDRVSFQNFTGGQERSAGPERQWESAPLRVACGRKAGGFLRLLQPPPAAH